MRAPEITRAGSAERARLLRVDSCDVALDFTRGPEIFGSVSRIRFDCAEPGAATHVDLVARAVHEITLNGAPLDYTEGRIILPNLAGRNELRVVADCSYTDSGTGMHRSDEGGTHIYGKLAQAYARTAFACFDHTGRSCPINPSILPNAVMSALAPSDFCGPGGCRRSPRLWSRATTTWCGRRTLIHRSRSSWLAGPSSRPTWTRGRFSS